MNVSNENSVMNEIIYLDHAATSPIRAEVLSAMMPWFQTPCNSGAMHHAYDVEILAAKVRAAHDK